MRTHGVAAFLWLSGCLFPSESASDETTGTTAADESSSGSSVDTGSDETTAAAVPWPPDDGLLTCQRTCEGPWDCCPPGSMGLCPGTAYPYNVTCLEGVCAPAECTGSSDCARGEECTLVFGLTQCVAICTDDDGCPVETACKGTTDDGRSHCRAACNPTLSSCGIANCDPVSLSCVCQSNGQCIVDSICV